PVARFSAALTPPADPAPDPRPRSAAQRRRESREQAAELLDVSPSSVDRAAKVLRAGTPELAETVASGRIDVHTAARVADLPPADQQEVAAAPEPKTAAKAKLKRPEPAEPPHPLAAVMVAVSGTSRIVSAAVTGDTEPERRLRDYLA